MKWQRNMSQPKKQAKILKQLNEVEIGNLPEKIIQTIGSEDIQDLGKRIDTQFEKIMLVEESVTSLLYIFASFVKDKVSRCAKVYP